MASEKAPSPSTATCRPPSRSHSFSSSCARRAAASAREKGRGAGPGPAWAAADWRIISRMSGSSTCTWRSASGSMASAERRASDRAVVGSSPTTTTRRARPSADLRAAVLRSSRMTSTPCWFRSSAWGSVTSASIMTTAAPSWRAASAAATAETPWPTITRCREPHSWIKLSAMASPIWRAARNSTPSRGIAAPNQRAMSSVSGRVWPATSPCAVSIHSDR